MRKKTTILFLSMLVVGMTLAVVPSMALFDRVVPFVYGSSSSPSSFDPLGAYDTTSGDVINNVFEGLYAVDYSNDEIVPRLADSFITWNTDGTIGVVELREDVTWHDGTDFTAADVKWNFDRLNTLSDADLCEHASLWYNDDDDFMLNSTEATGTYEVTFTLAKAWFDFEKLLPFWGAAMIKPVDTFEDTIFDLTDIEVMMGTGPFMIDSYTPDEKTVLVRYEDYYGGAADIEKLIFQIFGSADAMDQAFLNYEIQVARSVTYDTEAVAEADPDLTIQKIKGSCAYFYHLSVTNIPHIARKAMSFAFNYSYFIEVVRNDREYELHTPVPEGMEGYNPDVPGLPYYNLTYARELILASDEYSAAAGTALLDADSTDADWEAVASGATPLDTFNFTHYGLTSWYDQMADNFADIGFNIISDVVGDWPTFLQYTDDNIEILEITMGGWCPDYYDPVNMIQPLFGTNQSSNWNNLANETIDANLALMHTTSGDAKDTLTDLVVTQIFVEQVAGMYIMQNKQFVCFNNVHVSTAGDLANVRGDKYFYNVTFNEDEVPQGIPGYSLGLFLFAALGASAALIIRKRK